MTLNRNQMEYLLKIWYVVRSPISWVYEWVYCNFFSAETRGTDWTLFLYWHLILEYQFDEVGRGYPKTVEETDQDRGGDCEDAAIWFKYYLTPKLYKDKCLFRVSFHTPLDSGAGAHIACVYKTKGGYIGAIHTGMLVKPEFGRPEADIARNIISKKYWGRIKTFGFGEYYMEGDHWKWRYFYRFDNYSVESPESLREFADKQKGRWETEGKALWAVIGNPCIHSELQNVIEPPVSSRRGYGLPRAPMPMPEFQRIDAKTARLKDAEDRVKEAEKRLEDHMAQLKKKMRRRDRFD